ncbi:hypothetical protein CEXT_607081 [Caerostris extrusa]|uniref:Uncharacterized protein n=1 Tax=Caerostris extrusa TaxID=172846 RepID=A0AAV4VGE3_CAEEX|nr:hypothetical protein CEXT_607081 [Caerostris extrusa]
MLIRSFWTQFSPAYLDSLPNPSPDPGVSIACPLVGEKSPVPFTSLFTTEFLPYVMIVRNSPRIPFPSIPEESSRGRHLERHTPENIQGVESLFYGVLFSDGG